MASSVVEIETRNSDRTPKRVFQLLRPSTDAFDAKTPVSYSQAVDASFSQESHTSISTSATPDTIARLVNVTVALVGLVLTAPLLLIIGLAIRLTSKGPVFYKQTRIGLDRRSGKAPSHEDSRIKDLGGRPFTMFKFRTMVAGAENDSREVWATPTDARVTAFGRLLRVTRLDELPQLWNVLAGDMNIVGPRPERPTIFAELRVAIPHYHLRQCVRPGITGWAQINQGYDTSLDDVRRKIEFDLEYVRTRSVTRDISIMARTVPIMVTGKLGW